MQKCTSCNGKGEIEVDEGSIDIEDYLSSIICPVCDGAGVTKDGEQEGWIIISFEHSLGNDEGLTFWRPNARGYTVFLSAAGIYDRKEAERTCKQANYTEVDEIAIDVNDAKKLAIKTSKNGEHIDLTQEQLEGMYKADMIKCYWPLPTKSKQR